MVHLFYLENLTFKSLNIKDDSTIGKLQSSTEFSNNSWFFWCNLFKLPSHLFNASSFYPSNKMSVGHFMVLWILAFVIRLHIKWKKVKFKSAHFAITLLVLTESFDWGSKLAPLIEVWFIWCSTFNFLLSSFSYVRKSLVGFMHLIESTFGCVPQSLVRI